MIFRITITAVDQKIVIFRIPIGTLDNEDIESADSLIACLFWDSPSFPHKRAAWGFLVSDSHVDATSAPSGNKNETTAPFPAPLQSKHQNRQR